MRAAKHIWSRTVPQRARVWTVAIVLASGVLTIPASAQPLPPKAARQFQQAIEHLRSQQYALAEHELSQLVRVFPQNPDVCEALGIVLDLQGKVEAATPHFEQAVRGNPRSAQARVNLGANYFRRGQLDAAAKQFQAALRLRPGDPTIHFNLGTLYLRRQQFGQALPHLEQAHQRQPQLIENSYQLALCYFFLRQHDKAAKLLEGLLPRAGQRGEFFFLLGLNQKALGRDTEAQEALRQAFERMPSSPDLHANLGPILLQLGLYVEGILLFENARKSNPESYEAAYYLARAYQGAGQLEKARVAASWALAKWETADLHHLLGEVNEELGGYLEAVQHFQRAAELDPSEPNIFDLGYEFLVHWSWDAAQAVFQKGLERFPKSGRFWLGLATAQYAQGEYNQAVESLLRAITAAPDDEMAYRQLIAAYPFSRGMTEQVQQRLRQFRQRHPNNAWANYCYALALWQTPDRRPAEAELAEATRLLERAVSLKPDQSEFHYQFGVMLSEQQQWSRALVALESAARLRPDYVEAHYRLALAYQRLGKSDQAQATLTRYLKLKEDQNAKLDSRTAQTAKFIYSLKP